MMKTCTSSSVTCTCFTHSSFPSLPCLSSYLFDSSIRGICALFSVETHLAAADKKKKKKDPKQQQSTLPLGVGTRADTHPYLQYLTSWHGTWLVDAEFFIRAPKPASVEHRL